MSSESKTTEGFSREEWIELFDAYIASMHCSLFGRHMSVSTTGGRRAAAEWYAELVERVCTPTGN